MAKKQMVRKRKASKPRVPLIYRLEMLAAGWRVAAKMSGKDVADSLTVCADEIKAERGHHA